jgi:FkbM family methyltransferase
MARSLRWRGQSVRRVTGLLSKMTMARLVVAEAFQAERERPAARKAVPVRVTSMNGRVVWLRPRSSDRAAFEFLYQGYHLPPESTGRVARIAVLGANIGLLLANLADRYPQARLLGVEPDPDNAALARRNLAHLGARCTVLEAAAWHRDEQLTLSWDADAWGQTLAPWPDRGGAAVALQVDAVAAGHVRVDAIDAGRLLDMFGNQGPIDYLLVNIESAWYEMLKHGEWTRNVRCIKIEIQDHYDEAVPLLEALGYRAQLRRLPWGAFVTGTRTWFPADRAPRPAVPEPGTIMASEESPVPGERPCGSRARRPLRPVPR